MKRFLLLFACLFNLAACGAPASTMPAPAFTSEAAETTQSEPLATPIASFPPGTDATPFPGTLEAIPTSTPNSTRAPDLSTPTETPLPTLALPALQVREPEYRFWSGLPTYPGDSDEAFLFALKYDTELWGQVEGHFGETVLASREIPGCIISTWSGRGLPLAWKVEHETRQVEQLFIDFSQVFANEILQFVTYTISDNKIVTSFQVAFSEQPNECLYAAEQVIYTFRSVRGNPTPTPSPTIIVEILPSETAFAPVTMEPTETSQTEP